MMKKIIAFCTFLLLLSCDDGNFNVPEFNFDDDINSCGDLLLSKINGTEVLVIEIAEDNSSTDNAFFTTERADETFVLSETGSNTIAYRTFDTAPTTSYFCQNIPPTSPSVVNEWLGTGTLQVTTTLSIDDEDGVDPSDEDLNGDGDLTNDDTDGDSIADYIDFDDDGDGITTAAEDVDGDNDPTNDDTDGDGIPNYLDTDDDGDGIDTLLESLSDDDLDGTPDYLDTDTAVERDARTPAENEFIGSYLSTFIITNLQLTNPDAETISFDIYDFGSKTVDVTNPVIETP